MKRDTYACPPKSKCVSRIGSRRVVETGDRAVGTYVFVIDQLHELEFSVGPLRVRHVLKRSGQLLNRHILRSDSVERRAATDMQERDFKIRPNRLSSRISRGRSFGS